MLTYEQALTKRKWKKVEKKEKKKKFRSHKKYVGDNLPIKMIIRYTGLSEEEIEKLR